MGGQRGPRPALRRRVIYNFHTAQLTVGYMPDLFGGNRGQVESLESQAEIQRYQLEATYVTLASNDVAAAAIQEAMLRRQIAITQDMIGANVSPLSWCGVNRGRLRVAPGGGSAGSVAGAGQAAAAAAAKAVRADTRPVARAGRRRAGSRTAGVLRPRRVGAAGRTAGEPAFAAGRTAPRCPRGRGATACGQRAGRRRDGQPPAAVLDRRQRGRRRGHFGQMFWSPARFFSLAAGVTQPIFDAGAPHRQRAAEAAYDQAAAQYQGTVLTALQNVADSLRAIHADADALKAAVDVEHSAKTSMELIRRQRAKGYVDRLAQLGAEQTHHQALLTVAQAQATRLGDTVALFQALLAAGRATRPSLGPPRPVASCATGPCAAARVRGTARRRASCAGSPRRRCRRCRA